MSKSKVKWFNEKRGYGFIVNPDGGEDIFVHYSNIDTHHRFKLLKQNSEVDFEVDHRGKKLQAKKVRQLPDFS